MYSLSDYRDMIADPVRTEAYVRALRAAVRPGATVVEIGTGVGYFAIVACRTGAAQVVAIEPDPAIHITAELARLNDCADRISFVQDLSSRVSLDPADVLVSDLRGVLPPYGWHIPSIVDARRRLLKPEGTLIPERDTMWVALAGAPSSSDSTRPADAERVDFEPLDRAIANSWWRVHLRAADLMTIAHPWHTIDYKTVIGTDVEGTAELEAERSGDAHGLCVWFDSELYGGHGFSNAPGASQTLYGQGFFPFPTPIPLEAGDRVRVELRAKLVGSDYVWSWRGRVIHGASAGQSFAQSTFHGTPLAPETLRKRADVFVPRLSRRGEAQAWMLARMSADVSLRAIAEGALAAFPDLFPDSPEALRHAADLSEQFSQ